MSEPRLISPMLDNFLMGDPISDHNGVRCCPAMHKETEDKYLVKVISIPSSRTSLDALLLTGAYANETEALTYFEELANGVNRENDVLTKLSKLEGFIPFEDCQIVPMEDDVGFDIYLLSPYKRTLEKQFRRVPMTHLAAINLGIDLCAALAVCRRSGYIYADLKPGNVFVIDGNSYRIGDLGFLPLDGLKYTSLPDKYRSEYTAPEITDAFSDLNTTIDIYAAGLILYQAYNDGVLPTTANESAEEAFPPPAYADYEMAEIILKACAPNPADRWQDPVEMGQALISYMQRNGANDTPIVPQVVPETPDDTNEAIPEEETVIDADAAEDSEGHGMYEQTDVTDPTSESSSNTNIEAEPIEVEDITEESIYTEDEHGNLTFLEEENIDETAPESTTDEVTYDEVTDEVSEIMTYADELISHPAPDPVVAPEKIDVPMPEPIITNNQAEDIAESGEYTEAESNDDGSEISVEEDLSESVDTDETVDTEDEIPVKVGHLVRNVCIAFFALLLILAGFYYYRYIYTQHVSIQLTGAEGALTVYVDSQFDESKLTVVCTDTYGNQLKERVENGNAVFSDLLPNAAYTVQVKADGFHRLTGKTSTAYSTPSQTSIVQFSAVCGSEDGGVILNFAVDGNDTEQWKIRYSAQDEEEKEVVFTGHIATLNNLTIGKEYTFILEPLDEMYFTGENTITFTATKLIRAENLTVKDFSNGNLTVSWSVPDGVSVESWTVQCYDGGEYNESAVITGSTATFENVDSDSSYTVEVIAAGMHYGEQLFVAKNPIHINNLTASVKTPETITLIWETDNEVSSSGWVLKYSMDGSASQEISGFTDNTVQVPGIPAGAVCNFVLEAADGAPVFDGTVSFTMPTTQTFNRYDLTPDDLIINMCHTPNKDDWSYRDLTTADYSTSFSVGDRASFLATLKKIRGESTDVITTTYIIKDATGNIVSNESEQAVWNDMWDNGHCALDIPSLPSAAGEYTVYVYFNEQLLHSSDFTME